MVNPIAIKVTTGSYSGGNPEFPLFGKTRIHCGTKTLNYYQQER